MTPMRTSRAAVAMSDHQSAVAAIEKAQEFLDLRKSLQLFLGALARLREIQVGIEEQTIGPLQLALNVLRHAVALQANLVQAVKTIGFPFAFTYGGTSLDTREQPPVKL